MIRELIQLDEHSLSNAKILVDMLSIVGKSNIDLDMDVFEKICLKYNIYKADYYDIEKIANICISYYGNPENIETYYSNTNSLEFLYTIEKCFELSQALDILDLIVYNFILDNTDSKFKALSDFSNSLVNSKYNTFSEYIKELCQILNECDANIDDLFIGDYKIVSFNHKLFEEFYNIFDRNIDQISVLFNKSLNITYDYPHEFSFMKESKFNNFKSRFNILLTYSPQHNSNYHCYEYITENEDDELYYKEFCCSIISSIIPKLDDDSKNTITEFILS